MGVWFLYSEIYTAVAQDADSITFQIKKDETVNQLADRLEKEGVIRNAWFFKKYLQWKNLDKKIPAGEFKVSRPITLARVVGAIDSPAVSDRTITIIPGWNLRDVAVYLEGQGIGSQADFYQLVGYPPLVKGKITADFVTQYPNIELLKNFPAIKNLEGLLAPETYRIYQDASLNDVVIKLLGERDGQFTVEMKKDIAKSGHSINEVITMASIVEREANNPADMAIVADIFWRRFKENWALQSCATVNYVTNKSMTRPSAADLAVSSAYNTYQNRGLPPGSIAFPSRSSIHAVLHATANPYYFFLTTTDGQVIYSRTGAEHSAAKKKYLR